MRTPGIRAAAALALTALAAGAAPASAPAASSAYVDGEWVVVDGDDGVNQIDVSSPSRWIFLVRDESGVTAGKDCSQRDERTARCRMPIPNLGEDQDPSRVVMVKAGGGDDEVRIGPRPGDESWGNVHGSLDGGTGDDLLHDSTNGPGIRGGPGADTIAVTSATKSPFGGAWLFGEQGDDVINAGDGDERIDPGTGRDLVAAGGGDDDIDASGTENDTAGSVVDPGDVIDGGGGRDSVSYYYRSVPIEVDLEREGGQGAEGEDDRLIGIEDVEGSARVGSRLFGNDADNELLYADVVEGRGGNDVLEGFGEIRGGDGDDRLTAFDGSDVLEGGAGDDVLAGGDQRRDVPPCHISCSTFLYLADGADVLDGGPGTDRVTYERRTSPIRVDLRQTGGQGDPSVNDGQGEGDTIVGVEDVTGGTRDDHLIGNASANLLQGALGDDRLETRDRGADRADCGGGSDHATIDDSDAVAACEVVDSAPIPPLPPEPGPGPGGETTPPAAAVRTLRVSPRRDRRAPYRFRLTGRVTPCTGLVSLVARAHGRTLASRRAAVGGDCRFRAVLRLRRRGAARISVTYRPAAGATPVRRTLRVVAGPRPGA